MVTQRSAKPCIRVRFSSVPPKKSDSNPEAFAEQAKRGRSVREDVGRVLELVDSADLKSVELIAREGSSPSSPTKRNFKHNSFLSALEN